MVKSFPGWLSKKNQKFKNQKESELKHTVFLNFRNLFRYFIALQLYVDIYLFKLIEYVLVAVGAG